MKQFPRWGMRPIAASIQAFWQRSDARARRGLVLTYPHYLYLCEQLAPDIVLYYNIDDYTLYWPRHAAELRRLEHELVRRADATICVARSRADELRAALPDAAGKIHHLPHGTPAPFLADEPCHRPARAPQEIAGLPRPLLGYVGSIGPRVDWRLMTRLSEAFPLASLVVVGDRPHPRRKKEPWFGDWLGFASRANVHHTGPRSQDQLPLYYQAFDVNLIPYVQDHPFNRACCPTKIADGLGSGRPMVATAIPECRLSAHLFDVAENADAFVDAVQFILAHGSDDGRCGLRHEHAREHTCRATAASILRLLQWVIEPEPSFGEAPRQAATAPS